MKGIITIKKHVETVLVAALVLILTVANSWHIIAPYFSTPPGRVYVGISHYHEDYFYYLSQMTQGSLGSWTVKNLYSSEPIMAVPLWWPNILLGKIQAVTGLYPWTVYDLSVFLAAGASLIVLYGVSRKLFPHDPVRRITTFVVASFTTCYYLVQRNTEGRLFINPYQFFYNYTESLNRLGGVFHLILQNILTVGVILGAAAVLTHVFVKPLPVKSFAKTLAATSLLVFLLMFINPVYILVDAAAVSVTAVLYLLLKRPGLKKIGTLLISSAVVGLPLLIPYAVMTRAFTDPFYQYFRWWEATVYPTNPIIFTYSMGPIIIFVILGLIPFLKKATPLKILGLVWTIVPILMYFSPLPKMLQIPHFRLLQPPVYIFLGAMAVEGMMLPGAILTRLLKKNLRLPIFFLILVPYLSFQIPMIIHEINARTTNAAFTGWLNYLEPGVVEGLTWLKRQPHDGIAIGVNNMEVIIPAISGQTVYEGHHSLTFGYNEKVVTNAKFFSGQMSAQEAGEFLKGNRVGYVVWRNADGDPQFLPRAYPFLNTVYANPSMTVFAPRFGENGL